MKVQPPKFEDLARNAQPIGERNGLPLYTHRSSPRGALIWPRKWNDPTLRWRDRAREVVRRKRCGHALVEALIADFKRGGFSIRANSVLAVSAGLRATEDTRVQEVLAALQAQGLITRIMWQQPDGLTVRVIFPLTSDETERRKQPAADFDTTPLVFTEADVDDAFSYAWDIVAAHLANPENGVAANAIEGVGQWLYRILVAFLSNPQFEGCRIHRKGPKKLSENDLLSLLIQRLR